MMAVPRFNSYKLIKTRPVDPCAVFEALATRIQRRDRCDRVTALQRAVDEHPEQFEAYCRAVVTDP
jgi:hypothetical protein